jgi:hypothetical protein
MDLRSQKQLIPHYVAVVILLVAALSGLRELLGAGRVWIRLVVVACVVLTYPTVVRLLGIEPDVWQSDD